MEGCRRHNCTSFNFGGNQCELHATFVCEGSEGLVARPGFRYYDVEVGDMIPEVNFTETKMAAAMAPGSVDVNTQNEQHYLRLHLLVMKAGDVLRAKFDSIATPNNLLNELKKHKRMQHKHVASLDQKEFEDDWSLLESN
ncbi:hypothetical protein MAR_026143 [Mya arenaria]|uniref:Uncharacterized protein n=1 Tax=Mya arenaria TaxID=6604 RepID=A0ABY7ETS8_MYAAR|nr:hypothetical protein MAR_026143 [Mya arenaria]